MAPVLEYDIEDGACTDVMPITLQALSVEPPRLAVEKRELTAKEHMTSSIGRLNRALAVVAAMLIVCMLTVLVFRSGVAPGNDARRLKESPEFTEMDMVGPILVIATAAFGNGCSVCGALGGESMQDTTAAHLAKMILLDSIDQLVSMYLVIWVMAVDIGDGAKALAVASVILGMPAFFANMGTMQYYMKKGDEEPYMMSNMVGILADGCSIGAMMVIEFTSNEKELLPDWLKGLDFAWSFLSLIGEVVAVIHAHMSKQKGSR